MGELLNAFNNSSQDNLPSNPNDNLGSDGIDQFNVIIPRAKKLQVECPFKEEVHDLVMENVQKQFCEENVDYVEMMEENIDGRYPMIFADNFLMDVEREGYEEIGESWHVLIYDCNEWL